MCVKRVEEGAGAVLSFFLLAGAGFFFAFFFFLLSSSSASVSVFLLFLFVVELADFDRLRRLNQLAISAAL